MKRKRGVALLLSAAMAFTMAAAILPPDAAKAEATKGVLMYRLYNPNSGEHFYTSNANEGMNLTIDGWEYETIGWVAPQLSNTPVYRLYNPNSGEHHYTKDAGERNTLVGLGWKDEGIGWYSDENQNTPLYRLYNPNAAGLHEAGSHHYTKDENEKNSLIASGWRDEGIGWYGEKMEGDIPELKEYPISGQYVNGDGFWPDLAVFTLKDNENGVLSVSLAFTDSEGGVGPTYATSDMTFDGKNAVGEIDGTPVHLQFKNAFPHPYAEGWGPYMILHCYDPEGRFLALNRTLKEGTSFYNLSRPQR